MGSIVVRIIVFFLFSGAGWLPFPVAASDAGGILVLEIQGAIGPATSDYIGRSLESAREQQAGLVIIRMDTPGGLDSSMRGIVQHITTSAVPVATLVAPSGARAASAGTYILYASHLAAMAPGTNLGAATPVQLGGLPQGDGGPEPKEGEGQKAESAPLKGDAMTRKLVNDAAAYLRGLAQMRGRNAEWAEKAVREGLSLSAVEALDRGVIDLMADGVPDLIRQLDGREVTIQGGGRVLHTEGATVQYLDPDWRSKLLAIIANPNLAYVLMLLGIYGLIYEFSNPGAFLPGTVGAICLLLALYAFQVLPINYAGFALILLGLALMIGELFAPSFGALGIGGIASFVFGSIILIDSEAPGYGISLPLILSFAIVSAMALMLMVGMAIRSRQRPIVSGREQLLGEVGQALDSFQGDGSVRVHGEVWNAHSDGPVGTGQRVRITGRQGLTLEVSPMTEIEE